MIHVQYGLLKTWADYLVSNTLYPRNQYVVLTHCGYAYTFTQRRVSIPSGEVTNNSTNLALQGIVAIQAMSVISSEAGEHNDSQHYSVGAHRLACPARR